VYEKAIVADHDMRKPQTQNLIIALRKRRGRNVNMKRNPSMH